MKKKIINYVIFVLLVLIPVNYLQAIMYIPGDYNSWSLDSTGILYTTNSPLNYVKRIIQPVSGSYFKLVKNNWGDANEWSAGYWINSFNHTWNIPRNDQGNNNNGKFTNYPFINFYIIVTSLSNPSGINERFGFLVTTNYPVKVTIVTDNSESGVESTESVHIRMTLNTAKSYQERIYLRYTSDSWTSDDFILTSASNTTIYTCTVPAQNKACTVEYYILTTTTNWSLGNDLDNYTDLMTINLNNNSGVNYSYSVSSASKITIDGDDDDWHGMVSLQPNIAVISSNEWIWKDKTSDRRGDHDSGNLGNYDCIEARVTLDSNNIYFLFKFDDINDITKPYVAFSIDTDQNVADTAMNWIADDSGILIGSNYGKANANSHYAECNVIIHHAGTNVTQIEMFTNGGSSWFAPPTEGGDTCYVDPTDNLIEVLISRKDVGLDGNVTARIHFTFCKNADPAIWANNGDSTYAYSICDAVDSISIPGMMTNDKYNDMSSWNEDISDGNIDFWVEFSISSEGVISNSIPPASANPTPTNNAVNVSVTPALNWGKVTDSDDETTSYLLELSSVTNLSSTVLLRVNLTNTNYSITGALPDGLTYYWRIRARDRRGVLTANAPLWKFTTIETQTVPSPTTPAFTPYIDGVKDTTWGTNPYIVSLQSNLPNNYAEDLYISNDPDYLYIAWKMHDDPWDESGEGYDKSAHYGFVFDSKHEPTGCEDDPFISGGTTKVSWTFKPDIWVEGWIKTGYTSFGKLIKFIWNESSMGWDEYTLDDGGDFSIITNSWGEFRIPLSELDIQLGEKVNMIAYFRPTEDKAGVSDSIPYDSSCNDYAENASTLTSKTPYRIQYAFVNTWHYPDIEEVAGLGKMRTPISPKSSEKTDIAIGVFPYNGYDTAVIYYSTNNWANTNIISLKEYQSSGNNIYLKAEIGPFRKNIVVKYYSSVTRNGMTTYNYGSDLSSSITSNRMTAQVNAYEFLVNNSAPEMPSISISPLYVFTNDTIIAAVTSATDVDGDTLECYFSWYKNNVWQSNLDLFDNAIPFQSKISNFNSGDNWACRVRLYDGDLFSEEAVSSSAVVLLNKWLENIVLITNSGRMTNNEFIWYDRKNDMRSDVTISDPENYDLTEFHVKADVEYIYFLFRFNQIKQDYRIGIAMSIDTNQTSGTASIGDEMNLTLGSNYSGTFNERLSDVNLLFHSFMIGSPGVELKKTLDSQWTVLTDTNAVFNIYKNADFAEARIKRNLLGLTGDKLARISLVVYKDYVGLANDVDLSVDFSGNDGIDVLGVGISEGTNIKNYSDNISTYEEELDDNTVDFWFDIKFSPNNTLTNTPPSVVSGFSPANFSAINDLTPTLTWTANSDPDLTGYYLKLGLNSGDLIYQVHLKTNSFTVQSNLPYGYTNYSWCVYSRDRTGTLSVFASNLIFTNKISAPFAGQVMDNMNINNYSETGGTADADGDVVFNWAPSIDPVGIANYYICVGTSPGGIDIINDLQLAGNQTVYTATSLSKGRFYYAKIKALNNSSVTGYYGLASDGIYVSKILIDNDTTDWADKTISSNSTVISNGIGIWQDALLDARNDYTNLDMEKFKVAFDYYNMYLYFKFTSSKPWADGEHFIQVTVDNDSYSDTRAFIGRSIENADLFVSSEASWEYLIKILSGGSFDTCYACDTSYGNWQRGVYKDNAGDRTIECAIPLNKIGGISKFLNSTVNISAAIFKNNAGNVEAIDGDSTPDALDVISTNTGSDPTWDAISDRALDYYLECKIAPDGMITSFTGKSVKYTQPPSYPSVGASSAGWVQNAIMYFLFVDRFYNGDTGNDITGDTTRKGGDFKGIMDNVDYLRGLNINCIYMAPPMKHGGAAGYDPSDWWDVDENFGGNNEFRDLIKTLNRNSIDLIIDWPGTAIGGGKTVDDNPNWAGYYNSPWGDWPEWTVGMAEVQQFFVDTLMHWSAKGVKGYRMDYAKFDGNPVDHGHQYWQYVRARLKDKFPDRYMFGEIFDGAHKISTYTWDGKELDGCFDFPLEEYGSGGIIKWALQQSIDSGTFWSEIQNSENTYGNNPIMVSFIDNHDKDRGLRRAGGDSWKMRLALGFTLTWHEPTSIFYGTEMGMDGWRDGDDLDNSPCIDMMWGINSDVTPSWAGYNYTQHSFVKRLLAGKRSFPGLRSSSKTGGVNVRYASGQWFIYERNYNNDAVLVILNRSSSSANIPRNDFTTWADRSWRDWMNGSDYFLTGSDGKFTGDVNVAGNDVRVLVSREYGSGGYGECSISGTVNVPDAIIQIKDYAGGIYSRVCQADGNGQYSLNNIVCKDTGNEDRTVKVWAPGYEIQYHNVTVWDTANVSLDPILSIDGSSPDFPLGLSCRGGDGIVECTWSKNTEDDFGSYAIYRSETFSGEYTKLDEVLDNAYIDRDVENDRTYYYKIRAKDINGNTSGFSKAVSVSAGPIQVTFWLNLNDSGLNNIERVLIRGNTEKMNFWGMFGDEPEMEDAGCGWWKISFEFDQRMGIMYKYKVLSDGTWTEEGYFSGSGTWYGNRYINFNDQGNKQMNIFNKWNSLGDAPPMKVENFSASPCDSQVSLSWDKNKETDIQFYSIYRATPLITGPYSKLADVNALYNMYIDKEVSNGVSCHYYITAIDGNDNEGQKSKTNSAMPQANDTTPPSVPTGVTVFGYSTNHVKIIWNANNEADLAGYNVYRSNQGGSWQKLNETIVHVQTNPSYIDNVLPGVNYYYRVSAIDDSANANESINSETAHAMLVKTRFYVDMGDISLSEVKISGNKLPFTLDGINMEQESDTVWYVYAGLLANVVYQYKYVYDGNFEDDFDTWHKNRELTINATNNSEIEITDDWECQPDVPENVWAFPLNKKVKIHWDEVTESEDLQGYNVYYSTNAAVKFENKVNEEVITENEFIVEGLENNKTYYFIVRAIDSGQIELESSDSEIVSAIPKKSVPVYFRTSVDDSALKIAYVEKTGGYVLRIR